MSATEVLSGAFREWRDSPWWAHALAVFGLAAIVGIRWLTWILHPEPLADEVHYFKAFMDVLKGANPYRGGYYYPPAFAFAGAFLVERLGQVGALAAVRIANLAGVAITAWCALAWVPASLRMRWLAGAAFLTSAPAVSMGIRLGNLSLAISGLIVLALTIWPRRPILAGNLLGISIAIKPVAPLALGALFLHRSAYSNARHLLTAAWGMVLGCFLLLAFPYRAEMFALGAGSLGNRSVSLHRIPHILGLRDYGLWVAIFVALIVAIVVRRRVLGRLQLSSVAIAATLAATPLVWGHTLLVALPIQSSALVAMIARGPEGRKRWEGIFVVLAVAAILFAQGATGIDDRGVLLQLFGVLPPALSPTILAIYLLRVTETV